MYLTDASDAIRCKAFPTSFTKTAIKWFDSLPPRSIASFDDLAKKFLAGFSIQKDKTKHAPSLLGIKQGDQESLRSYMERFNKACLDIQNLSTEAAIMGLINGLREGPFSHSISKKHPTSFNEVQERANKYINMEENSRLGETSKTEFSYPPRDKNKKSRKKEDQPIEKPRKYHDYTPLLVSLVDVYREVCNTEKIPPPCLIKHKRGGCRTKYCEYDRIYGHSTNECYDLKNVIEKLDIEGRLDRFLASTRDEPKKRRMDEEGERAERPPRTPERHVHMINGGFAGRRISKSSYKRHLQEVYHVGEGKRSSDLPIIIFTQEDAAGIISGHDDSVVITIVLANANLHRTLVDQGSSADILFKSTFDKLGLQEKELRAYSDNLFGLGDAPIRPLGYLSLHTTYGKRTRSRTLSIEYIVVDVSSAYNTLIGRTTLNQLTVVVSTPHLCMKFPTPEGIATIKGAQKLARHCYNESLNLKDNPGGKETNTIKLERIRAREELRPQPKGETKEVQIGDAQDKVTNIGATLKGDLKELLIQFLKDNSDLFA
ncbi:uncharacterized protein LOC107479958 [Arachis duranensis]|uniref:Uncharacterized protein LOC107479958 n=1 Tax=Arachis duranensis TaxID=130453 RepID=A0A6P4CWC6_ARADU|nr:uncharacterized protein LOC107479958 [Arachis duranensis]